MKNKISEYGLYTTGNLVFLGKQWCSGSRMGTEGYVDRVRILQVRCVSCRQRAMPNFIFAPTLGYIGCPDDRVRPQLPR